MGAGHGNMKGPSTPLAQSVAEYGIAAWGPQAPKTEMAQLRKSMNDILCQWTGLPKSIGKMLLLGLAEAGSLHGGMLKERN